MTSRSLASSLRSDAEGRLDQLPYGRLLDLSFRKSGDEVWLSMPYADALVGAPGRLHGGAIAGLLEIAALARVITALPETDRSPRIRPVTITVDFMREGTPAETIASAEITRLGRRIANVVVRAWQADRTRPIAGANVNFLIDYPDA
ncbi:MAG: PaaI family thioesterase [Polymorphobacter sp.]|uniref:PaaI family thioesterase n=1 Tax=Polymorphobacter sp. TaxID=1909290 RepID=UPI003A845FD8